MRPRKPETGANMRADRGVEDARARPFSGDADDSLGLRECLVSAAPLQRARFPGPLSDGADRPPSNRRRVARQVRGLSIARVSEVVCAEYGIERSELGERGSRHPARAAMAYLARRHTAATNGELTKILGVSRPESGTAITRRLVGASPRAPSTPARPAHQDRPQDAERQL